MAIGEGKLGAPTPGVAGYAGRVRGQERVGEIEQWMVRGQGFAGENIEAGAEDALFAQRGDQRVFGDDGAAVG